jgi:dTMP kinase
MKPAKKTKPESARGLLVVFEGLDGAGKSTHIAAVKKRLEKLDRRVTVTRWVSDGVVGRTIHGLLDDRAAISRHGFSALHAADLADRFSRRILPALKRGDVVLCDRYTYTQVARDEALGLDPAWTEKLFGWAPDPDLVIFLDLPVEQSFERIRYRILHAPARKRGSRELEGTTSIALASDYQPDGEPMTELARRKQLREVQAKVAASYVRQGAEHGFIRIDANRSLRDVRDAVVERVLATIPS